MNSHPTIDQKMQAGIGFVFWGTELDAEMIRRLLLKDQPYNERKHK